MDEDSDDPEEYELDKACVYYDKDMYGFFWVPDATLLCNSDDDQEQFLMRILEKERVEEVP